MKSSFSNPTGSCVDAELDDDGNVVISHSATKGLQHATYITYTPAEWEAFLAGVKDGQFERNKIPVRVKA
ncbi:MAG TPA: DUF397 domain-containing protein [Nitrospiraceae bacterium]|nr:DUF397 domain-containing protein [Nitrospiraceae bacterium]